MTDERVQEILAVDQNVRDLLGEIKAHYPPPPAELERALEERGLIVIDHRPYATLTAKGRRLIAEPVTCAFCGRRGEDPHNPNCESEG